MNSIRGQADRLVRRTKRHVQFWSSVLYYLLREPATPRLTRVLAGITLGYLLSPIDLIPDFIPILGQLDDMLIVPLLLVLTVRSIPHDIREQCMAKARRSPVRPEKNPKAAAVIVLIWIIMIALIIVTLSR
ncbi:MAG: YkvA family protein [Rectinema sp.]|nr:YkvA family protein [Rectinema sp.]